MTLLHCGFLCCRGPTLEQVMVEGWVGRQYCCHLVVVRRMDVFVNTVACELHLPGDRKIGQVTGLSRVGARGETTEQVCHGLTSCGDILAAHTLAKCKKRTAPVRALYCVPDPDPGKSQEHRPGLQRVLSGRGTQDSRQTEGWRWHPRLEAWTRSFRQETPQDTKAASVPPSLPCHVRGMASWPCVFCTPWRAMSTQRLTS